MATPPKSKITTMSTSTASIGFSRPTSGRTHVLHAGCHKLSCQPGRRLSRFDHLIAWTDVKREDRPARGKSPSPRHFPCPCTQKLTDIEHLPLSVMSDRRTSTNGCRGFSAAPRRYLEVTIRLIADKLRLPSGSRSWLLPCCCRRTVLLVGCYGNALAPWRSDSPVRVLYFPLSGEARRSRTPAALRRNNLGVGLKVVKTNQTPPRTTSS